MIVYPAIDLMDGQVVRLKQGDFERKTVFSSNPEEMVKKLSDQGAKCLHLVDLSGAREPEARQTQLIGKVIRQFARPVQVGGGIRTLKDMQDLIEVGADRLVLGSLLVTAPQVAIEAATKFGASRFTLALDVQLQNGEPIVMTHGWSKSSGLSFSQVLEPFLKAGFRRVLCTDISVDGLPTGPNVTLYHSLREHFPELEIQASGGVDSLADLKALAELGVHSVVVGRALLSGAFQLSEAMAHAQ